MEFLCGFTCRAIIISGCVSFAKKVMGTSRIEAEFLPQCWEQVMSNYDFRSACFIPLMHDVPK